MIRGSAASPTVQKAAQGIRSRPLRSARACIGTCRMRLCDQELRAMNSPLRRFFHRRIEFPLFRLVGLRVEGQDVLEVGCGTGYGAELLARLGPKSYLGVDLMPEMIELANRRQIPGCEFVVGDAVHQKPASPTSSRDLADETAISDCEMRGMLQVEPWQGDMARKEPFLGRALAGTTEVLASSMPSGSNAGNGHVRIKRVMPC